MLYILLIMTMIYGLYYLFELKNFNKDKQIHCSLLYVYICLILFLTIIPRDFSLNPNYKNVIPLQYPFDNLRPFNDLFLMRKGAVIDIVLNILMMIPFGFLYSKVKNNNNLFKVVVITFLFSLFIESFQLITSIFLIYQRSFDVTDILTNTLGGLLGYSFYKILIKLKQ